MRAIGDAIRFTKAMMGSVSMEEKTKEKVEKKPYVKPELEKLEQLSEITEGTPSPS